MTASKIQSRPNAIHNSRSSSGRSLAFNASENTNFINNNRIRSGTAARCLFGAPKPAETKRLFDEQIQRDRQRIISKYGFDVMTERPCNNSFTSTSSSASIGANNSARIDSDNLCNIKNSKLKDSPKKPYSRQQKSSPLDFCLTSKTNNNTKISTHDKEKATGKRLC